MEGFKESSLQQQQDPGSIPPLSHTTYILKKGNKLRWELHKSRQSLVNPVGFRRNPEVKQANYKLPVISIFVK